MLPLSAVQVAQTLGEHASLWAIRVALLILSVGFGLQAWGISATERRLAILWMVGAISACSHSIGALLTFHHGSQAEALRSTAEQTLELIGVSFSAGLYFNYVFDAVWLIDATLRLGFPKAFQVLPKAYHALTLGFLAFIAFNGTVVFKSGNLRWIGIAVSFVLLCIWAFRRYRECFFPSVENAAYE